MSMRLQPQIIVTDIDAALVDRLTRRVSEEIERRAHLAVSAPRLFDLSAFERRGRRARRSASASPWSLDARTVEPGLQV